MDAKELTKLANRITDSLIDEYLSRKQNRVAYLNYNMKRSYYITSGSFTPGKTVARFTSYPSIDDVKIALLSTTAIEPTPDEVDAMQREYEDELEESWYTWLHPVETCDRDY